MTSPFRKQPGDPAVLRYDLTHCPQCGAAQDAISRPNPFAPVEHIPETGDYVVCLNCTGINVFEVSPLGVTVRAATLAEYDEFMADPETRAALGRLEAFRRKTRNRRQ